MTKKTLSVFAILLVVLVSVSLVAAQGQLPGSGWKSGQQIQNVGSADASIVFQAYGPTGTPYNCGSQSAAPGGSVNFLTDVNCDTVPAGFVGSAVVSADQPIAAIVNVNNRGVGAAAGQYRGTDGADVANSIAFPLVKNAFNGRTTTFYVQNASTNPNTINATFNVNGTDYTKSYPNVASNAMVVISPADANVPTGVFGSLTVTGSQPLAGTSLEHEASAPVAQNLQASKAFTPNDYDTEAFCPLVRNRQAASQQITGIQAQNVGAAPQTITVEYAYSVGGGATQSKTVTSDVIPVGGSANFYSADAAAGIPDGAIGSATVSGDGGGNIAVVVNDRSNNPAVNPIRLTTYACFAASSASSNVVLPLYKEFFGGNTIGIQVQNVGAAPATVQVTYTPTGAGSPVTFTAPAIQPGASSTFYSPSTLASPTGISVVGGGSAPSLNNSFGGVTITADQPIVAIANESMTPVNPSGQDTKNYEGFNQ